MSGWRQDVARSLRAAVARTLMAGSPVRIVDPLTRRRVRHLGVTLCTDPALVSAYTRAELFWGLYERAECSYVDRYLAGAAYVIELGAGIGVSSAHIASHLSRGATLICVEANAAFLPSIARNVDRYLQRSGSRGTIVHAAIGSGDAPAILNVAANPFESSVGSVADPDAAKVVPVPVRSLRSILDEHQPEWFDLVCDIEGAEGEVIMSSGLERCRRLVIELHDCTVGERAFKIEELLDELRGRWGFRTLERNGPVVAMARDQRDT